MRFGLRRLLVAAALVCLSTAFAQKPEDIPSSVFASLNGFTAARLSPDGEHLAYLYPINGRHNLVIHEFGSGENTVVPPIGTLDFNWLRWANDKVIVFSLSYKAARHSTDTTETRLVSVNIDTKTVTPLVKPAERVGATLGSRTARSYYAEAQIQDRIVDWLIDDPDHILVILDEDFDNAHEIRKINVNTGDYRIFRKSNPGIQGWIVDRDGEPRLGYGYKKGKFWIILKSAEGDWIPLPKQDWYEYWRPLAFTEDPSAIYVRGYGVHGTLELRSLNINDGAFIETFHSDSRYDYDDLILHPVTTDISGYSYVADRERRIYFDQELAKLQKSVDKALPGMYNTITSTSADKKKILIVSSSAQEPGGLFIWDRGAGTLEPFGWYNENLDPEMMAEVRPVEYESADGTMIPAYLTLPRNREANNLPALVIPHGGPMSRDDQSYWFVSQFLASRGYAVLQPNFRGSTGYGYDFERAGRGQWGGVMQDDVDTGTRWLAAEGIADPERICIAGWSYGGYSAAMGLIKSPEVYRCGIGINGVYNLPALIAYDKKYVGGSTWTRHMGLEGESTRSVSPYHQVEKIQAPFLIMHAEDDSRVEIKQAEDLHKALQESGAESELVTFPLGGHSMRNADARVHILDELERFLAEQLVAR